MERVLAPNSPEHLDRCQKYATNLADYVTKEDWKAAKKLLDTIKSERDTGTLTKSDVAFIINNKLEIKGFSVHFLEGILVLNEDIELARCFLSFDELNLQLYALDTPLTCVISRQRAVRMGIKRTDFSSLIDLLLSKSQVDIHAQSSMRVSPLYLSIDLNYDYALQRLLARKDLELDQTNGELKKTAFDLLVTEGDELQLNPLSLARLLHAYNKRGKSQKVKEFIISCDTSFKQRALRHLVNLVFNDRDEKLFGEIVNCDAFDLKDISYEKEFLHYFLRLCKNKNKLQDYVLNTKFKITQKLTQKYVDGSTVLHLMLTSRAFNNIVIMLGANEYKVIIWNIKDEKGQTPLGFLMDFAEFSSGEIVGYLKKIVNHLLKNLSALYDNCPEKHRVMLLNWLYNLQERSIVTASQYQDAEKIIERRNSSDSAKKLPKSPVPLLPSSVQEPESAREPESAQEPESVQIKKLKRTKKTQEKETVKTAEPARRPEPQQAPKSIPIQEAAQTPERTQDKKNIHTKGKKKGQEQESIANKPSKKVSGAEMLSHFDEDNRKAIPIPSIVQSHEQIATEESASQSLNHTAAVEPIPVQSYELHLACLQKDLEGVRTLLESNSIDVNACLENPSASDGLEWFKGQPPLHIAIYTGELKIIELLLEYPTINVNMVNNSGSTALHLVFTPERKEIFKRLINHPALCIEPELIKNIDFVSWLFIYCNNKDRLESIVHHPEFPRNKAGLVHLACMLMNNDLLSILIESELFDLSVQNQRGGTALHIALSPEFMNFKNVLLLSRHESFYAHWHIPNKDDITPLMLLIAYFDGYLAWRQTPQQNAKKIEFGDIEKNLARILTHEDIVRGAKENFSSLWIEKFVVLLTFVFKENEISKVTYDNAINILSPQLGASKALEQIGIELKSLRKKTEYLFFKGSSQEQEEWQRSVELLLNSIRGYLIEKPTCESLKFIYQKLKLFLPAFSNGLSLSQDCQGIFEEIMQKITQELSSKEYLLQDPLYVRLNEAKKQDLPPPKRIVTIPCN